MATLDKLISNIGKDFKLDTGIEEMRPEQDGLEVLFHLPLLAMSILTAASLKQTEISTETASYWVARTLMELYSNFLFSMQRIRLSSALRKRTVDAIIFLEALEFIEVGLDSKKLLKITDKGKLILSKYKLNQGERSLLLRRIESAIKRTESKGMGLF